MTAGEAKQAMMTLPLAPLHAITGGQPVLILAPHADDESLGCGGLIAASAAEGVLPFVLVLTDGSKSHPNSPSFPPARLIATREQETRDALAALGLSPEHAAFLRLPDAAAPIAGAEFGAAVQAIVDAAARAGARTILAPWEHDPHCDHEAAHLMAVKAAGQAGLSHWAYPVWGWTLPDEHQLPNRLVEGVRLQMEQFLPAKRRAIACHETQYAGLISDSPTGFRLPPGLLAVFDRPFETFVRP